MCGGGGYVAGKSKRSGDWGKEEHIRVQLNIERQQFSQPTKELTNTRPRGLRIWYKIFPEKEYRGLSPNFHIHVSVSELYIPTMGLPFLLEEICGLGYNDFNNLVMQTL
jgi:hypothetical protein